MILISISFSILRIGFQIFGRDTVPKLLIISKDNNGKLYVFVGQIIIIIIIIIIIKGD